MNTTSDSLWEVMRETYQPTQVKLGYDTYINNYEHRSFRSGDIAELCHENTKLHERLSQPLGRTTAEFETPRMQYLQATVSSDYPGSELIELPLDIDVTGNLSDILSNRRSVRDYSDRGISRRQLSQLLLYSCGPTAEEEVEHLGVTISRQFRAYPSGGALYPVEIYPVVVNADDLESGVYYYSLANHGLRRLSSDDPENQLDAAFLDPVSEWDTSVVLVFTGAFWRSKMKYGPRAYRYVLQESGHIAQNIQLVAKAIDIGSVPLASFYDDKLNDLVEVDGVNEAVVYTIALGTPAPGEA